MIVWDAKSERSFFASSFLYRKLLFYDIKKDAQLAERQIIASQYRSREKELRATF